MYIVLIASDRRSNYGKNNIQRKGKYMAVIVPAIIYRSILEVRDLGLTNMLDRPRVIEILNQLQLHVAAIWVEENRKLYSQGVFEGFQPAKDEEV